ncbi:hypothetical protein M902_2022 [Bacteriovorax sp. BAL6_X]|uniref:hypothetical protein n=1 Tax=Bacteriovorax sp. BAL6_X TaxID=1201290 RepID=UPI000386AA43|nr:hypothetical protein [Bacteriovorax sp. BAL6_X]EPZ51785.1 hypothetical protein M902_2022 [Bacteriovorax sp. BAL6_X]
MIKISTISICKLVIILILPSIAFASNASDFISTMKKHVGEYNTLVKNSDFCDASEIQFVDEKSPMKGLRIGHRIFIGPLTDKNKSEKSDCTYTSTFTYTKTKVVQISEVKNCMPSTKQKDSLSTQTLEIKSDMINYESKESGIKCSYIKVQKNKEAK